METTVRIVTGALLLSIGLTFASCAGNSIPGNENGSEPINDQEATEYKKAIVRCYKTGGTRVVKVMGELRCY